jgi:hypothetical protein
VAKTRKKKNSKKHNVLYHLSHINPTFTKGIRRAHIALNADFEIGFPNCNWMPSGVCESAPVSVHVPTFPAFQSLGEAKNKIPLTCAAFIRSMQQTTPGIKFINILLLPKWKMHMPFIWHDITVGFYQTA